MKGYRRVEDFIGDPTESEFALSAMRSEFALEPFDKAVYDGENYLLFSGNEVRGSVNAEALALLGAQA